MLKLVPERDDLGSTVDADFGNHSVVIAGFVATEVKREESLVHLGDLEQKV